MGDREQVREIDQVLRSLYPETTALRFSDSFTLLVAAILAAQCTDERVNRVTESLFGEFPDPASFAEAPLTEIEKAIHSTGFYRQKAKTLKACCAEMVSRFEGKVPESVDEMTTLPGVGRKTANLVLGNSRGVPGVFVDTHVKRVSYRLGLTKHTDPDKIEADLTPLVDEKRRVAFSNLLTHLGRAVCTAQKPNCPECPVGHLCPKVGIG